MRVGRGLQVIRQDLVPQSRGGVNLDPELRPKISGVPLGCTTIGAGLCGRRRFGFVLFFLQHGRAAARAGIVDPKPRLDAVLVKEVAVAALFAARHDGVPGLKVLEADGAAVSLCRGNRDLAAFRTTSRSTTGSSTAGNIGRFVVFRFIMIIIVVVVFVANVPEGLGESSFEGRRTLLLILLVAQLLVVCRRSGVHAPGFDAKLEQNHPDGALDQDHERQIGGDHRHQDGRAALNEFRLAGVAIRGSDQIDCHDQ